MSLSQGGDVLLDMVSLFPAANGVEGTTSPFRANLLALLKGLHPKCVCRKRQLGACRAAHQPACHSMHARCKPQEVYLPSLGIAILTIPVVSRPLKGSEGECGGRTANVKYYCLQHAKTVVKPRACCPDCAGSCASPAAAMWRA